MGNRSGKNARIERAVADHRRKYPEAQILVLRPEDGVEYPILPDPPAVVFDDATPFTDEEYERIIAARYFP